MISKQIKQVGFFPSTNYINHKNGCFKDYFFFSFKSKNKLLTWHDKGFCSCDSKDVLYLLICNNCVIFSILDKLKKLNNVHENINQM